VGDTATLGFSLFNLSDANRVGLDLDGITGSDDLSTLAADLSLFSGLAQGTGINWLTTLDTSNIGVFHTSYLLRMSNADIGAASSRFAYNLILDLLGRIEDMLVQSVLI
jgi:hypothetical protein